MLFRATVVVATLVAAAASVTGRAASDAAGDGPPICRVDALWHGGSASPSASAPGARETVSFKTSFGPPAVLSNVDGEWQVPDIARVFHPGLANKTAATSSYYEVGHAAVPCAATGCLYEAGHGCNAVASGKNTQCVWWGGPEEAAAACDLWTDCKAFWCGTASDVTNSTDNTCWARGAAGLDRAPDFHNATSYVQVAPSDNSFAASCTSVNCSWTWGVGRIHRKPLVPAVRVELDRSDGVHLEGTLSDDCTTITWSSGATWTNVNLNTSVVHVVYMAHFDVGYTVDTVKALLAQYVQDFFPKAFATAEAIRARGGPEQFAWTSHAWLIDALLRNDTGETTPAFREQLVQAIERGDVRWHANPMNMQSESGERQNMEYGMTMSPELDAMFNQSKKIAASQKDCPGATLGMVRMFADAGVKMLHMGVNDFSTVPALPTASPGYHGYCNPAMWRDTTDADGDPARTAAELLLLYCSGYSGPYEYGVETPNMVTSVPGFDEALAFLMHVDNRGPQSAQQVVEGWAAVRRAYPNAKVQLSTLDEWTTRLLAARPSLPDVALPTVSDVEPGSTWIYGVASQPRKMRRYRVAARLAAAALRAGTIVAGDPRMREFNRFMLKVPEHTWGASSGCEGDFTNKQLDNPSYACFPGQPEYVSTVGSWTDQEQYVEAGVAALQGVEPLHSSIVAALAASEPSVPDGTGMTPFDVSANVTTLSGITVRFNGSGAIVALGQREAAAAWAGPDHPLGLLRYATHSDAELRAFGSNYALEHCRDACGNCAFSKCNLDKAQAESKHHVPIATGALADLTRGRFLMNLSWTDPEVLTKYGAPQYATLEVTLVPAGGRNSSSRGVNASFDLQWWSKRPTRMAESVWMTFNPLLGSAPQGARAGWQMDKLGKWVDPLSVVTNGSKTMHAVWSGIRHRDGNGTVDALIETLDSPVVMPGDSLVPTGAFNMPDIGEAHPERGWSFNLFNNAWSTNFPVFTIDPNERFRWNLYLP